MDRIVKAAKNTAETATGITEPGRGTAGAVREKYSSACLPLGNPQATYSFGEVEFHTFHKTQIIHYLLDYPRLIIRYHWIMMAVEGLYQTDLSFQNWNIHPVLRRHISSG